MAIKIKKTGELNTFTIELTGKHSAKNLHEAQKVFDALDELLIDNYDKIDLVKSEK